ncbi:hypothetical protein [Filibacter tadaridae]|uniref:hypothetical protein n=1 Tax=Filibacter tadaridae TaxID=2483811 RepID=UPI0011CD3DB8|nr:hypothetical protein [Filibacter tadaridae]
MRIACLFVRITRNDSGFWQLVFCSFCFGFWWIDRFGGMFERAGICFDRFGGFFERAGICFDRFGGFFERAGICFDRFGGFFERAGICFDRFGGFFERAAVGDLNIKKLLYLLGGLAVFH